MAVWTGVEALFYPVPQIVWHWSLAVGKSATQKVGPIVLSHTISFFL